jgi:large repetitive protein
MRLVLEPRHLFDGSVAAVAAKATHAALEQQHDHAQADGQLSAHRDAHDAAAHHGPADASHSSGAQSQANASHSNIDVPALAANPKATEVLFVDPRVANWQTLAASVDKSVQVIVIDPNRDGISQVTQALQGRSDLKSIQFLTYGSAGQIELGNAPITADALAAAKQQVASWSDHLASNADIEFWGCDVGQGASGQQFVDTVHALTGAQVGASTDATGAASLDGNWTLERTTGALAIGSPFSESAIAAYHGVLDTPVPSVTFVSGTIPHDVLLGGTFTETVQFQNTASNAAGYGPFIDLYVPSDSAENVTLTGATYLGSTVTVDKVTLSTSIAGHVGTLGALHPLALDSSGNALFVAAPGGYQAGDSMYVLQLPFGSYTPGEPAAQIQLSFSVANTTELSSMHGGQALNISAIGGFQYGTDPLNNPAADPSIRGTTGTASVTSSGDGLVTASTQVSLIDVSATTDLHEGETATGPDFPFDYVITLQPAAVTQVDPMQNVTFTFTLPDQVTYTGGTISFTEPSGVHGTATFNPKAGSVGGAGGTVTLTFTSLGTDASNTATLVKIPVFVPQVDASGASVLGAAGQPRTVDTTAIYNYTGSWTAVTGSLDHSAGAQTIAGDSSTNLESTSFVAKSLAIQVTDDAPGGNIVPGQVVGYSINFQVSDYYSLNQLNLADLIGDGVSLLAPADAGYATPALSLTTGGATHSYSFGDASNNVEKTINGQSVAESGSNGSNWSYTRDDTGSTSSPGATALTFDVGQLIEANLGGAAFAGVLQGGTVNGSSGPTQGTITFKAKVLDKYTNANSGDSVREKDSIADVVTTQGTSAAVVTVDDVAHTITGTNGTVTDDSSVANEVAPGQLVLQVVAVNGQTADLTDIKPGDTVTYAMTYQLNSGDYGNLDLTAYLPLPVFSTTDPLSNGGNVSTFSMDSADAFPTAGTYKLVNPLSGENTPTVTTNGTANSISFNFGDRDDPTNVAGQKVVVYFSAIVSNKPFTNGLQLTTQGGSTYTNAEGQTLAAAAIKQVPLEEPELATKTGVVSIVGDGGASKGTYSADASNAASVTWTSQTNLTPSGGGSSPFAPAGTPAGTNPFTGNGDPLAADNLNVKGGDGGDLARVVSTVQNQGGSAAYDVTIQGTLPSGYSTGDVQNFAIYNSAGQQVDAGVTAAQYFGAGGVQLSSSIAAHDNLYVVYDLKLPTAQETGDSLTFSSNVVNWASVAGGVGSGSGFVSGTGASAKPIGENAAALSDTAIANLSAPTVTKTVTQASDTVDIPLTASNNVTLGETVTYQITVALPQGTTANGSGDVTLTDSLPAGMTFGSLNSVTFGSGVSSPGGAGAVTASVSGSTITFDLGSSLTNAQVDANGTVTLVYTATVTSTDTPVDGTARTNSVAIHYDSTQTSPAASATIHEVDPNVAETITVKDTTSGTVIGNNGTVYSNENLTYTVTLKNNGDAPAQNLADLVNLPSGLNYVPGSLTYVSGGAGGSTSDTSGLAVGLSSLGVGQSATFTFQATVAPNQTAGSTMAVSTPNDSTSGTYYSLPGVAQGHKYTDSASTTVKIAQISPVLSITGESNNTDTVHTPSQTNTQTSVTATVGEIVTLHGYVQIPEGANPTTLDFALPPGLAYLNDGSAKIAFVSPNGDLVSSDGTLSGIAQFQDGNSGNANYVNPVTGTTTAGDVATFQPTSQLPSGVVTTTGGHVSIDLSTLSNNDGSPVGNYVIVEFNAVVGNVAANVQGAAAMAASLTVGGVTSNNVDVSVKEPTVTVTKTATAVDNTTGTVTYQVTVKNTGASTAYNVVVDDPAAANESHVTFVSATGAGTGGAAQAGTTASDLNYAIGQLGAGGTETLTYTVQVAPGQTVQNDTAAVVWQSLAGQQTFNGSTGGAVGSTTGARDFDSSVGAPDTYRATATTQLGTASGRVWQDVGNDTTTYATSGGSADTGLGGITVTAKVTEGDGTVVTETTTTAADGTYTFGALPQGTVVVSLPAAGSGGLPANETLAYNDGNAVTGSPASASFTANGDAHANVNFSYQAPDTAPAIAGWGGNADSYVEGGAPVRLSGPGASVTDTQLDGLGDYSGTTLTLQRYTGGTAAPSGSDVFAAIGPLALAGGNVSYNGTTVGTYTEAGGELSITFGAGATATTVNEVLDNVAYSSTDTSTVSTGIQIGATLDDHNVAGMQGTGGNMTSAPVFVTINEVPGAGSSSATFTEPNDASPAGAAIAVDPTVTVTSADTFSGATVTIGGNYRAGEDVLVVTGTLPAGVTASFDAATGTMTLTGANLSAATVQNALRAISYYDSSDTPSTAARSVTIAVMDNVTHATTTAAVATVDVVAANDSPVLNGLPATATSLEDNGAPSGQAGMLVSQLTGNGNVTDADGAGAHDGQTPGAAGIAITAADTSEGTWWYSTDNGSHWTAFAGQGQTAISPGNALHLIADGNTRLYFEPAKADWNGTVPNALTFRAWDQFDGVANGAISALPGTGTFGQGLNTAASAYSSAQESIPLSVVAINDAPIASGSATMPTIPEDTAAPAPQTVSSLFGSHFGDSADQQQSGTNVAGSVANTLAGIAITGNAADPTQGAWQYSTDNGASWHTIATAGLSDSNALVLSSSAELRFIPAANFNGEPGQLTTRLIDTSNTAVTGAVTGAQLGATDTAITGVDVSGAHNGGSTAVSVQTVTLGIDITPVNDAPIASGTATIGTVNQSERNPTGATVTTLFGGDFNDSTDQQHSAVNPTGSTANPFAGVAIVGDGASASQGSWQYSSDGGKTWTNVPAEGLNDHNALVLSATDSLRFLPSGTFSGTPGALAVRLIDSSGAAPVTDASGVDLGAVGGISPYSAATVALTAQIQPNNHVVHSDPTALIPDFNAPNDYNKLGGQVDPRNPFASQDQHFPDDGLVPPAEGRGYRPNLYGEPIIPQVNLTGSVGSRFIIEQQQSVIAVPSNLFNDTYPNAELQYDAHMPGGAPLPAWLVFDARNLTFTGTPPAGSHGTVEVELVARDQFGNQAQATFQITVGRESKDLEQMLAHMHAAAQDTHHAAPAHDGHVRHGKHDARHHAPAPQTHGAGAGRPAFSAQLRDAGPIGKILQARRMVHSVVGAAAMETAKSSS